MIDRQRPIYRSRLLQLGLLVVVVVGAAGACVAQEHTISDAERALTMPPQEAADVARPDGSPPNIVFILADDLGYGDISTYGGAVSTPSLDQLAEEGMLFMDFHSSAPVCSPTRAGLLTGRYQQRSGLDQVLFSKPDRNRHHGLHPEEITIAELLREAGYATAVVGKWHLGYERKFNPIHHGFDVFRGLVSGNVDYISHTDASGYYDWWDGDRLVNEPGYVTHLLTEHALSFIEEHQNQPFFLYLAHQAPHTPFQGPDEQPFRLVGKSTGARRNPDTDADTYRKMVEELDAGVGEVLERIKRVGLAENTLVFFLSDNGAIHGSNEPLRGRKGTLWEGGHRVPAIAWWPSRIRAGTVTDQLVISLDLMPTALALAGTEAPPGHSLDGINLLPLLLDGSDLDPRMLFWQQGKQASVRDGSWKFLREGQADDGIYLFDLEADPYERENLVDDHLERVREMLDALERWSSNVTSGATAQPDAP